jgi:hypothetical protein
VDPHPSLLAAGYTPDEAKPVAQAFPQELNNPLNMRGKIEINKNNVSKNPETKLFPSWFYSNRNPQSYGRSISMGITKNRDILGHELTHTLQTNTDNLIQGRERNFPIISDNDTEERKQSKLYSQDAQEPAANMSDLKHLYYGATKKILPADMTDEDISDFKKWYKDTPSIQNWDKDDTIQLLDTPEGEELFRRTAKVNKPNTSDTHYA